jgi:xylulokinase
MSENYLIGIDIGTQGTKTTLFSADGRRIADAFEQSNLISPSPGIVEQEPDEIYSSVLNTIKEVMQKSGADPGAVLGIGMDGQMAGILGIDGDWNAVTPYDSWLDTRCEKYIRKIKAEAEELAISITGCPVTYAHGPKVLWWKHERPEAYGRISKFIMATTYVAGRLAGLKASQAYIDHTHLHFSGFGDVKRNCWSDELIERFGVDREKLPDIVEPTKVIGRVTGEAAAECGLKEGIPVVAGCGDQSATSLGAGVTKKGISFDVAGTASVFSCCVDSFNPDVRHKTLLYARSVIPGLWIPMAYINGGGLCIRWFRENLTGSGKPASYQELDAEASKLPPGSEGLLFLPHFGGRVCPNNPDVRGTWIGLNWAHGRGHMYRAVLEGIAYEYAVYLKILKELVGEVSISEVLAIGGGARSKVFNSIKADVLGIPYTTMSNTDTATFGSAIVAGCGTNVYNDFEQPLKMQNSLLDRIPADKGRHIEYGRYIEIYEKLFGALADTFRRLNEMR